MNIWKQGLNKVISALVVISTVATGAGVVAVRPVAAAESGPRPGLYLPVRWRGQGTDDPPFVVYLPVVMRNYTPPAEAIIEPDTGGQIGSPDGSVVAVFPPGAVSEQTIVSLEAMSPVSRTVSSYSVSHFALQATAAGSGTPVSQFSVPITLSVRYSTSTAGDRLSFYYRDAETGTWVGLPTQYDSANHIVYAHTTHLTEFIVAASAASEVIELAPAIDEPSGPIPFTFFTRDVVVNYSGGSAMVSSHPDSLYVLAADDAVRIVVTRPDSSVWSFYHESYTHDFPPIDLSPHLGLGDNNIHIELIDLMGPRRGGGWFYLLLGGDIVLDTVPPTVSDVWWRQDGAGSTLVMATITDNVAVASALLWWNGLAFTMWVDGDQYYAIVPGELNGVVGHFRIEAMDSSGNVGYWPDGGGTQAERVRYTNYAGAKENTTTAFDPVNTATGNVFVQAQDLVVPGPGMPFEFRRFYNSVAAPLDGPLGFGWTHSYNVHLQVVDDPLLHGVVVTYEDGHTANFEDDGSGGYSAPPGDHNTLAHEGSGFVLTQPDQVKYHFDDNGRLTSIEDLNHNTILLAYTGDDLTQITDTAGRTYYLEYTDHRLVRITDPLSRTCEYTYDGDGNLRTYQNPEGGLYQYTYAGEHWLHSITDPEGYVFITNTYDERGRATAQQDASGSTSSATYLTERQVAFTDNTGNVFTHTYDSDLRIVEIVNADGGRVTNEYDADHNLTRRTDANGNTTRYEYDERGNVTARYDPIPAGSFYTTDVTRWAYDEHNQVVSMTNALGYTWLYEYDAAGNLVHTIAPDASQTWAAYNTWGQPAVITDALGHAAHYVYDTYGNRTHTIDPAGHVVTSTYDVAGRETSYTDANGRTVYFEYDGNDNIVRITDPKGSGSTFEYDDNDLLIRSVDRRDGERLYEYDENLKLAAERDPQGNWTYYGYDTLYRRVAMTDTLGHVTRYAYDEVGRLIAVTDPTSATTRYEYDAVGNQTAVVDPLGHRTRMVYDAANRLRFLVDAAGNRTEYCYDAEDQLVRTIGPRGEVTDTTYDAVGRLLAVKDPLGNVTEYEYDGAGNRIAETNPLGSRTDYTYDELDRVIVIARPELPGGERPTTQFAYDAVGNTLVITSPRGFATAYTYDENDDVVTIADPLGGETSYTYDAEDNPVTVTDADSHTITTTYNLAGLPVQVQDALGYTTTMEYDAAYNLVQQVNALGRATAYAYDPLGRLLKETDPLGSETRYTRDALGRVTAAADASDHTTAYDYDALGRLVGVTDALSGTTAYGYDQVGNLAVITDANGHATTFAYNFLNQLTRETNPLDNSWWYAYDDIGHLVRRVDAAWHATYYDYDSNDRLTAVRYGVTPPAMQPVTFTYDLDSNETGMCDGLGCTAHTYDALGRRTSTADWLGRTITRTYDAVGSLTGLAYPNGYAVAYAYNPNDWLVTFADPHGASSAFDYNPLGQMTQAQHANGTRAELAYDDAGRLLDLVNRGPGGGVQSAYRYMLDAVGNRIQTAEARAPFDGLGANVVLTHTYEYDALDRLVRAVTVDPASDTAYTFDAVGNRLSKVGTVLAPDPGVPQLPVAPRPEVVDYTYNEANQLTTVSGQSSAVNLDYNPNGDRIQETEVLTDGTTLVTAYTYDREDRLVGVTKTVSDTAGITVTMVATYTYDGYGRRALKEVVEYTSPITFHVSRFTYLYDGLDIIGAQLEENGVVTETYYYLAPSPVTGLRRPLEMERLANPATGFAGDRHWYQSDGLDSVVALTDEGGALALPYLYDEYGQMLAGTTELQVFAYTGQDYDAETGFHHFYARYYDADVGMWTTRDWHGGKPDIPLSQHRYLYVLANPIALTDVLGLYPDEGYCKAHPDLPECQELPEAIRNYIADRAGDLEMIADFIEKGKLSNLDAVDIILELLENETDWLDRLGFDQSGLRQCREKTFIAQTIVSFVGAYGGSPASAIWLIAHEEEVNRLIGEKGPQVLQAGADVILGMTEKVGTVTNTEFFEKITVEWPSCIGSKIIYGIGWLLTGGQIEIPSCTSEESVQEQPGTIELLDTFPEGYDPCPYCA